MLHASISVYYVQIIVIVLIIFQKDRTLHINDVLIGLILKTSQLYLLHIIPQCAPPLCGLTCLEVITKLGLPTQRNYELAVNKVAIRKYNVWLHLQASDLNNTSLIFSTRKLFKCISHGTGNQLKFKCNFVFIVWMLFVSNWKY